MGRDPGLKTYDKECIAEHRLMTGVEIPEGSAAQDSTYLELWESDRGDRTWAIAILDDYRHHLADGIRIKIDDEEAGYLRREFVDESGDS